jgi:hypothetical protein
VGNGVNSLAINKEGPVHLSETVATHCLDRQKCTVISYASGKNKHSFMQLVDNGMYAMTINEGVDTVIVEGNNGSNDDNEVLGAVSEEGLPLQAEEDTDFDDVDMQTDPIKLDSWDPFGHGGVPSSEGFTYIGKLSFICFCPTSKYFASTLAMGGQSYRTVEEKKDGSRKAQRKINTERANMDREVGIERGMTMHAQMQCTFMAQNEDDAIQHHQDMRMLMLAKSIESTERLVELKMKMSDRMSVDGSETHSLMVINLLMSKLEQLNADLDSMVLEVRLTNPIVGNVLDNVKKAMGLETTANGTAGRLETTEETMGMLKRDEDSDNDGDYVKEMLKDGD